MVDGNWTHDHTARTEQDDSGITNNVLSPEDIQSASISSVAPGSRYVLYRMLSLQPTDLYHSTTEMAGKQPHEKEVSDDMPGAYPETPGFQTPMEDNQMFSVNPIPATEGAGNPIKLAPGEKVPEPSTYNSRSSSYNAYDDPELKNRTPESINIFAVDPIPATGGASNPIKLEPGEKVPEPSTYTGNTVTSNVKLDKESYEKSDTGAPVLPPVLTPQTEAEANGASMFGLPPVSGTMIPESSLPMGDAPKATDAEPSFTTSSVGPQSTTAQLAGQVPLEPRGVPGVVSKSQDQAHVGPEASASAEAVEEKREVENELKETIPEAPATAESGVTGGAAVPEVVSESQEKANVDPEAAASTDPVQEKEQMEEELKSKVPMEPATSESGAFGSSERGVTGAIAGGAVAAGAAVTAAAYAAKDKATKVTGADTTATTTTTTEHHGQVPEVVSESQQKAHVDPEAAASTEAVNEKEQMEEELKAKVPEEPATSESGLLGKSERGVTGAAAGGLAAAGTVAAGAAYAAKDKATEATGQSSHYIPESVQNAINSMNSAIGTSSTSSAAPTSSAVPAEVTESQRQAHVSPEASASPEMVAEKSAMEAELLKEVKPAQESGEPAPTESAALAATAPVKPTDANGPATLPMTESSSALSPDSLAAEEPLDSSTDKAHPRISSLPPTDPGMGALNATAASPVAGKNGNLEPPAAPTPMDSRDVSPMSRPATQEAPVVTSGAESTTAPAVSKPAETTPQGTPQKKGRPDSSMFKDTFQDTPKSTKTTGTTDTAQTSGTQTSSATKEDAKKKRRSFFGKLKDKLRG